MPGAPLPATAGPQAAPSFIERVAQLTGLDKTVVAAWVKAEGAYAPNGTGGNNFLNVRESTSKSGVPLAGTTSKGFAQFHSAEDAAKETAHLINTSGNYLGIRQATKLGPKSQLAAIAASPWDSGHYGGGRNLYNDYASLTKGGGGGIDWGGIFGGATRVVGDIANPVGGAADVAGLIPGIPGIGSIPGVGTATSILTAPEKIAEQTAAVIGFVFNPSSWLRIGYIVGGGVFVIGGLFILAKSVGSSNAGQAVKESVKTAAELTPQGRELKYAKAQPASRQGVKRGPVKKHYTPGYEPRPKRSASTAQDYGEVPF